MLTDTQVQPGNCRWWHTTGSRQWVVLQRLLDGIGQLEGRLPSKLDDDALWPLLLNHIQHILNGQRLKVQPAAGVVVSRDSLRVAVHHDGFIPISSAVAQQNNHNNNDDDDNIDNNQNAFQLMMR